MKVGVFTPLLSQFPLDKVFEKLKALNISTVELGTGNYPGDPHCSLSMLKDKKALKEFKQKLDKQVSWYFDAAETFNHGNTHYDLGAGGRGLMTDCHDGTHASVIDYTSNGPTTWGGCHIKGLSVGMNYTF